METRDILGPPIEAGVAPCTDEASCPDVGKAPPPSCASGLECSGVSCCDYGVVPGGSFRMGRSLDGSDACPEGMRCYAEETPERDVVVLPFALDTFEVTVGRFRTFVDAYTATPPTAGAGAHPAIPGSGWDASFNQYLPSSREALIRRSNCDPSRYQTWTDSPEQETHPMNCVDWFTAFAFCIWDGGRLPTEEEWEFAAAGGDENRLFPWGRAPADRSRVEFQISSFADAGRPQDVGSKPNGRARWGHHDLAGSLYEWVIGQPTDHDAPSCPNCPKARRATRNVRGGTWLVTDMTFFRAAYRSGAIGEGHAGIPVGFRCARNL